MLPSAGHEPHFPPQPSLPHSLLSQSGVHSATQAPFEQVGASDGHSPHCPPQPSSPQLLPSQLGKHWSTTASLEQPVDAESRRVTRAVKNNFRADIVFIMPPMTAILTAQYSSGCGIIT
jgi:hypothetical protein